MDQMNHDRDEILYIDDIGDDVSQPLTVKPSEARVVPRLGTPLETDNADNADKPISDSETDDLETDDKLPIGFALRGMDDGLLPDRPFSPGAPVAASGSIPYFAQPPLSVVPDVNVYQQKKTLAQGMMDLALLSANANQLRYVLQTNGNHPFYYPSLSMIGASLFLQIAVGIGLIWNSRYNVKDDEEMHMAERANNWTVIGVFLVTILNVFISSFGVADEVVGTT